MNRTDLSKSQAYKAKNLENLLSIVEEATDSWVFFPEDEYATNEAIIPTNIMVRMAEALEAYYMAIPM